jgi:hypothetical protein
MSFETQSGAGLVVMAGLDPAIHVLAAGKKDVDARDKRGHDENLDSRERP